MNTEQARAIVKETFPQVFDKGRFRQFAVNLLNHIDESKAQAWNATYIKDAFKDHVKGYERLGTYTSPDSEKLDVLIVHLTAESKLQRTRTAIRNFVADHLKTRDGKEAALVAFVSPSEQKSWRFSYIKMEYAAVEKADGKVGVHTKLTPARRSSYIVGEGESCHTAQSRFLDLLLDTENHPTLAQIEDAFSVEAVTKEFFEQYKELFLELAEELQAIAKRDTAIGAEFAAKNVSTTDFAKKLMGQIVFLYFLQKKGWLGVPKGKDWGDGPHNFLRQLFDGKFGEYKNFFNDILEPLFYDTLATDRGHTAICEIFKCRIPFLNGGLFEPLAGYDWQKTEIIIPNSLFSNTKTTSTGDKGTGILDVFDRYNFTVNEAEPLEKEVAIDPEMLGKVFENLLEVKERKSKGSFYTPREIVHYMCQESLINYLDTAVNSSAETIGTEKRRQGLLGDEKAEQTLLTAAVRKELIPRADIETFIHSGDQASYYEAARVDGTSYQRKLPKTIETHARLLDDKLADIAVCDPAIGSGAFPVGMMQEIVRARSALTPYFNDVRDRTAYHFKRHAIQTSLYGVDIDPGAVEIAKLRLWLSLVVDEDDVKQIKPLPNLDYKVVSGNSLLGVEKNLFNTDLFKRLEELKPRYFDATDRNQKETFKHEIDDLIHKLTSGKEAFDFEIYFSEVMDKKRRGGFDVLIGNPPYVRQEEITSLKPLLQSSYESYDGRADLFVYFYERAVKVLKDGGSVAYISSNKWLRGKYGTPLRGFLSKHCAPKILLDFGELPIFAAATFPMIFLGQKNRVGTCQFAQITSLEPPYPNIPQVIENHGQRTSVGHFTEDSWCFSTQDDSAVITKMLSAKGRIPPETIMAGIKTGFNTAFWLDEATKDALIAKDSGCKKFIKPLLVGDDVRAWKTKQISTWIIYTPIGTDLRDLGPIKNHLQQWKTRLEQRALSQAWYELQQAQQRYCRLFENPKIVYPDIAKEPRFTLDVGGRYIDMTAFALASSDTCLLAILNSKAVWFFLKRTAAVLGDADKGGRLRLKRQFLEKVPIPAVPSEQQILLTRLVERTLSAKQRDAGADVSIMERELNKVVYALYGLTPDEIKLVEANIQA